MTDELIWVPPPTAVVTARHPFRFDAVTMEMEHGKTLEEIVAACGIPAWATARVWVDDWEIAREHWHCTRPRIGRRVTVRAVPAGGGEDSNKTLRLVLQVVVIVIAAVLTWWIGGLGGVIVAGLFVAAASYGINALLPPPKPRMRDAGGLGDVSPTYSLTGTRNQLAPYQAVPRLYGRHRLFPPLAAHPTTFGSGLTQTLSQLFTCGYGPVKIEDIRIGETPVYNYEGVSLEVREGWPGDAPLQTYPFVQYEEPLGVDLTPPVNQAQNSATRTTHENVDQIGVEVVFPRGMYRVDSKNNVLPFAGFLYVQASSPATGGNLVWLLNQRIEEQRPETLRFSWNWNMSAGYGRTTWDVVVTWWIPPEWSLEEKPNPVVVYDLQWSALRSARYEDPITIPGMSKIGLTLTASGQLTGVVDQLNAVATSILWRWSGSTWANGAWEQVPTRNPAWIYHDVLTGTANARPIPPDAIDWDTLLDWALYCEARGYTFDAVLDGQSTVFETLQLIAAAGRASFTLRDGKYSVVLDRPQATPVQLFTPRNSSGFKATRTFTDMPHALKVKFINPDGNWQLDERVVYDDAYDAATATKFEGFELFGCTNSDLAWRHGRYWLAAARLRPETYTLGVDIESLVAQRGDLVHVQHPVPLWGYASGRIVELLRNESNQVWAIALDECLDDVPNGTQLALRMRTQDGASLVRLAGTDPRPAMRITYFYPAPEVLPITVGDLVSVGEVGKETIPCVISRIEAGADFSALLTLVDAAPGIDLADQGAIPPWQSYISHRPTQNRLPPLPPVIDAIGSDESAMLLVGGAWLLAIRVACHAVSAADRIVPTQLALEYRPVGSTAQWRQLPVQPATVGVATFYVQPVEQGVAYDIRVRSFAERESVASAWTTVRHTVIGEATPPPPPINLQLDLDQTALRWQYPNPPVDFPGGFRVRVSYGAGGTWETASLLHDGLVSDTSFVLPALGAATYTFWVKAVDRTGNESRDAARLVSDYAGYVPTNIVASVDYTAQGFPGTVTDLTYSTPPPQLCNSVIDDPLFWTQDSADFWSNDAALFWGGVYGAGSYQIGIDVPVADAGTTLTLNWTGTGPWIVEYRVTGESLFWSDDDAPFWTSDDAFFWQQGGDEWRPWPGALVVSAQHYDIRWRTPGPDAACLTHVETVFDVEDVVEFLDDLAVPVGGLRLPIAEVYRKIVNVQLTVVQTVGQPLRVADVVDKSISGPFVRARLVDGTATAATVDAIIKGY
jgi:hypothetical protein